MKIIVDTCIWSAALRRTKQVQSAAIEELRCLITDHRVQMIGPIRQEVLSGIRDALQFKRLSQHIASFPDQPILTEDYVMAAKIAGTSELRIVTRHMLPSFTSYLIVNLTLSVPYMILGETSLSFLGLGLRPPAVSWGVLLQQAQNIRAVAIFPWLMIPGLWVVVTVLAFNFLGDGLRDAADPYK